MAFIDERHKAFADVLYKEDLTELYRYCRKYGVKISEKSDIAIANVLKAIHYCDDFTAEEKKIADKKRIEYGFNLTIHE